MRVPHFTLDRWFKGFDYGDIGAMTVLCKPPGRCLPVFAGVRTVLAGRARNPELHLNWLLTESRESREKDYWIYLGNFGVPGSISNNSLWEFCSDRTNFCLPAGVCSVLLADTPRVILKRASSIASLPKNWSLFSPGNGSGTVQSHPSWSWSSGTT